MEQDPCDVRPPLGWLKKHRPGCLIRSDGWCNIWRDPVIGGNTTHNRRVGRLQKHTLAMVICSSSYESDTWLMIIADGNLGWVRADWVFDA